MVPLDCIERVIATRRNVYSRAIFKTKTCTTHCHFKRVWHEQQQQRETADGTLSEAPSPNNAAKEGSSFQVDL